MDDREEVCLEEKVDRMRRSGMSTDEIAQDIGVDPGWVESLISMWEGEGSSTTQQERG